MRRAVLIAGSVAVLAGCGSSSSNTLSAGAFSAAANKICAAGNAAAKKFGPAATTPTAAANKLDKAAALFKTFGAQLSALKGPGNLEAARDAFVKNLDEQLAAAGAAAKAARAGQNAAFTSNLQKLSALSTAGNSLGGRLNAAECTHD